jgi:hypothetical protein
MGTTNEERVDRGEPVAWDASSDTACQRRLFDMRTEAEAWLTGIGGGRLTALYPGPDPVRVDAAVRPSQTECVVCGAPKPMPPPGPPDPPEWGGYHCREHRHLQPPRPRMHG